MNATTANRIFRQSIEDYHQTDDVDAPLHNPYPANNLSGLLYHKNWIDTVQWHLEDIIRSPSIHPDELVAIKRRIDQSNQDRTNTVELIDSELYEQFQTVTPSPQARMNSETPAWLLDRMSISATQTIPLPRANDPPRRIARPPAGGRAETRRPDRAGNRPCPLLR